MVGILGCTETNWEYWAILGIEEHIGTHREYTDILGRTRTYYEYWDILGIQGLTGTYWGVLG